VDKNEKIVKLIKAIQDAAKKKFAWGENDCVIFAAKCLEAQGDSSFCILTKYLGQYKDEFGAYMTMRRHGVHDPEELATQLLGPLRTPDDSAPVDGEIVSITPDGQSIPVLGVVFAGKAYFLTPVGMYTIPSHQVEKVWRTSLSKNEHENIA